MSNAKADSEETVYAVVTLEVPTAINLIQLAEALNRQGILVDGLDYVTGRSKGVDLWVPEKDLKMMTLRDKVGFFIGHHPGVEK